MCGFVGVIQLDGGQQCPSKEHLLQIVGTMLHRGPDLCGTYSDGVCGLAHQRLSIIDLSSAGRQPMANEDGQVWLAYNGEVYNHRELRRRFRLDEKGHRFASRTDSEALLHLYEEQGIDFVEHLNGMFAFALWDRRRQTLHLARDPFGVKPLFYARSGGALWFASEIKALLAVPGIAPRPNPEALYHYLSHNYIPGDLTAFEGVHELRPGHRLSVTRGTAPRIERFYDIDYDVDHSMTEREAVERSRELLLQAVDRQLVADVPVGVMLSGGMDSSALTALAAEARGDADFHTFSIGFDHGDFDESEYAKMVAKAVGTRHHEIKVTAESVRALMGKYLEYIDEPYADGSAIPTYLLAERAKEHVSVLLSGEGGDEFFSGYDTHAAYKARGMYRRVPGALRRWLVRPLVDALPVSRAKLSFEFKAKRFIRGAELDVAASHFFWRHVLSEEGKYSILRDPERFRRFAPSDHRFAEAYAGCAAADELNRLLYIDSCFHLPDDLMIKNDRMTMAHSLEARVPFTDLDLVNFLATVPVEHKLKGMRKKHLLRSALADALPRPVLEKKKVGLEMPYSRWLRAELYELGREALSADALRPLGFFDAAGVERLWQEHQAGRADHGRALWGLINYAMWFDKYITGAPAPRPEVAAAVSPAPALAAPVGEGAL